MIKINSDLCLGCGACAAICPGSFRLNDSGKAEAVNQDDIECAKNAASSCPAQAIEIK